MFVSVGLPLTSVGYLSCGVKLMTLKVGMVSVLTQLPRLCLLLSEFRTSELPESSRMKYGVYITISLLFIHRYPLKIEIMFIFHISLLLLLLILSDGTIHLFNQ